MTLPTIENIIQAYLYGTGTTIENGVKKLSLDGAEYMDKVGWMGNPAQFDIVQKFFEAGSLSAGTYDINQIASLLNISTVDISFDTQQYLWSNPAKDIGIGNYNLADRALIYNSVSFKLDGNISFIVDAQGNRSLQNVRVVPFDDNFDYTSDDGIAVTINPILDLLTDPGSIGSTVAIEYDNTGISTGTYTQTQYNQDKTNIETWSLNPLPESADLSTVVNSVQEIFSDAYAAVIGAGFLETKVASTLSWVVGKAIASAPFPTNEEYIDAIKTLWAAAQAYYSPLVLDLDNDGIELTNISTGAVYFDYNNDGAAEKAAGATGGDGFLAIDLNADGVINNGGELFGDQTGYNNGFLALQQYDSNEDGAITAEDAQWDDLRIWSDANLNGFSESSELQTLDAMLITQINLNYTDANYQISGNDIRQESSFVINGNTQDVADVYFAADTVNTVYDGDYTLDSDVLFLPTLRGYGDIADLHIAASIDNAATGNLKTLLTDFAGQNFATLFAANGNVIADVREILYRWSGVDSVSPTSRGAKADGQELGFLEALMGQDFLQQGYAHNPLGWRAGGGVHKTFIEALNFFTAELMAQGAGGELFTGDFFYNIATDSFEGINGIDTTALASLESEATGLANTALRTTFWGNVVRMVEYTVGTANLDATSLGNLEAAITASDATLDLNDILATLPYTQYAASDTLTGTTGNDTISGGAGDDLISGAAGNDTLNGDADADEIYGEAGADTLTGGTGDDYLDGGADNDTYVYNIGDGDDVIADSAGTDKIQFGAGIGSGDLSFARVSNGDMQITVTNGATVGHILISDHFTSGGGPARVCAHQTHPRIFARMRRPAANDNLRGTKISNACNARRRAPLTARMGANDDGCVQLKSA